VEVANLSPRRLLAPLATALLVAVVAGPLRPTTAAAALAWPGESWTASTDLTSLNPTGWASNLSGAYWNPATRRLWVCTNSPAKFWALHENGTGGFVIEREYTGTGDLEGITQISTAADRVLLVDEQARTIRSYRISDGTALTSWFLSTIPDWGNSGPEGIAFVPNAWLAASGFVDGGGVPYPQSVHGASGFGGIVFVAVQTSGWVYAFDLRTDGTFTFVGRYLTSRSESCEMTFDASIGTMYVLHNINGNLLETTDLTSTVSGSDRRFVTRAEIQVPSGSNIEGFAATPALTAAKAIGDGWCFFTDDDNASGALRWFRQLHSTLAKVEGDGQTAAAGSAVAVAPAVLAQDPFANPLPGFSATFAVTSGGGSVTGGDAVTGTSGVASVGAWILGSEPGVNTLAASGVNLSGSPQGFTATGVDLTAPTVAIAAVAPDPRGTAVDSIGIVFSEPVVDFDLADLRLSRDDGPDLLTGTEALTTSDRITWSLDASALTGVGGAYLLTVVPADITDDAGNPLAAGASESWLMDPTTSTGMAGQGPGAIRLGPPAPNPGRGGLRIPFTLARESAAELTVYDTRGRLIRTVARGTFTSGVHWAVWDGRSEEGAPARSGLYFYRLRVGSMVLAQRGLLVR
jgi:hypothetical protein